MTAAGTTVPIASATTATMSAAATAAVTAATTAGRTFFARASHINGQGTTLKFPAMELLNGLLGVFFRPHFHEPETTGFAREAVLHDVDFHHGTGRSEIVLQIVFDSAVAEVAHEQLVIHILYRISVARRATALHSGKLNLHRYAIEKDTNEPFILSVRA